jgi:hypothetical protein
MKITEGQFRRLVREQARLLLREARGEEDEGDGWGASASRDPYARWRNSSGGIRNPGDPENIIGRGPLPITVGGHTISGYEDVLADERRAIDPPAPFVGFSPAWYNAVNGGQFRVPWRKAVELKDSPGEFKLLKGTNPEAATPGEWVIIPALWDQPGHEPYNRIAKVTQVGSHKTRDGRSVGWARLRFDGENGTDSHEWSDALLRKVGGPDSDVEKRLISIGYFMRKWPPSGYEAEAPGKAPRMFEPEPEAGRGRSAIPEDDSPLSLSQLRALNRGKSTGPSRSSGPSDYGRRMSAANGIIRRFKDMAFRVGHKKWAEEGEMYRDMARGGMGDGDRFDYMEDEDYEKVVDELDDFFS